jgi:predicted dehydrogenase
MLHSNRPIRLALIGGGPGAAIGPVHLRAAMFDRRFELVAGAFSRDMERSARLGRELNLAPDRVHASAGALLAAEALRSDGVEAVAIATPNDSHFEIAAAALKAGLHVICDKPMTATLEEARALATILAQTNCVFALTYSYAGYAMIREARALVAAGALGNVRKVVVTYPQGWLATAVEAEIPGAAWRTDPARAGLGGSIGDIGIHAFQVAEYVSGIRVERLCADLSRVVSGRRLDDDCNILLRFEGNVPGVLIASQICLGERNGLTIQVYGDERSLIWTHDRPEELHLLDRDYRRETRFAGSAAIGPAGASATRLAAGHPEGFFEAFATLYGDFADAIGGKRDLIDDQLPGISEGLRSMAFIEAGVASSSRQSWVDMKAHLQ